MESRPSVDLVWHEYGDGGLLLEILADDYELRWSTAQAIGSAIRETPPTGLVDVVASYQNVYVSFDPLVTKHDAVRRRLAQLRLQSGARGPVRRFTIPVVYGGEFGPDLESAAAALGTSPDTIVERHLSDDWVVRFVGSPLGAPMMDGPRMPASVPRLDDPRARLEAGSVAISGYQSMIYNAASPGGWRVIGRTPLRLFDLERPPHVAYRAGDLFRFTPISESEWATRASREVSWETVAGDVP